MDGGGPHGDEAAGVADRLGGVDDQVHQHLTDLGGIARHLGEVSVELVPHHDPRGDRHLEEVHRVLDGGTHVHGLERDGFLSGVGEHLSRELRPPPGGGLDAAEALARR